MALIAMPLSGAAEEVSPAREAEAEGEGFKARTGPEIRVRVGKRIKTMALETYLVGVVSSEAWPKWNLEALKAQAVASRSFAMRRMLEVGAGGHLKSTVMDQVYDESRIRPGPAAAVEATRGEVLTYHGEPIRALFHSTCGGRTSAPSQVWGGVGEEYLVPVKCGYCEISPRFTWELRLPLRKLRRKLARLGLKNGAALELLPLDPDEAGRTRWVRLGSGRRAPQVSAQKLRLLLGFDVLRSAIFEARVERTQVVFTGRGSGHGVGMCQWGAEGMARAGKTYDEILEHYYPRTELRRAY